METGERKQVDSDNIGKLTIFGFNINKKILIFIFILLFTCIFLWQSYRVITADKGFHDDDRHFERVIKYYDNIFLGGKHILSGIPYPPLAYVVVQPFMYFRGASVESARIGLLIFSVIFIFSMFGIGYEIGDEYSGIAVMCLASSSSFIIFNSRQLFLEFPQTAMTALAFYLLLKTGLFENRKYSLLLGLVLALSFLTKWTTLLFMTVPVVLFIIPSIVKSVKSLLIFLIFIGTCSLITFRVIWYYGQDICSQPHYFWLLHYFLIMILPILLCLITLFFIEKKWEKADGYEKSGEYRVVNLALMSLLTILITSPWLFWANQGIKGLFETQMGIPRFPDEHFKVLIFFMKNMFGFSIPLLIIGVILIPLSRKNKKKLYILIVILLTFIFDSLIMIKMGHPPIRYLLSLLIMTSAISGYWIAYIGKFRLPVTIIIVLLSLMVIVCPFIVPKSKIEVGKRFIDYINIGKIKFAIPATSAKTDSYYQITSNAINWTLPYELNPKKIAVFRYKDFPFLAENIVACMLERRRRLDELYICNIDSKSTLNDKLESFQSFNKRNQRNFNAIFILHPEKQNTDNICKYIASALPELHFEKKIFGDEGKWRVTALRVRKRRDN